MGTGGGIFLFVVILAGFFLLVSLAIQAVVCWLLSGWTARIPPEHRKLTPGSVWLLMIPVFSMIWCFFVYPRIAASFESYFRSKGDGVNTGKGMALAYCLLVVALTPISILQIALNPAFHGEEPGPPGGPLFLLQMGGGCMSLVLLVLWILLLVKFHGLQKRIPAAA